MNKKFKALALAMSMAFVAPSMAIAAETSLDQKIENLDKEIYKIEKDYNVLNEVYDDLRKHSKDYVNKDGKIVYDEKSISDNLFKISTELDKYVSNTVPSIEQAMLGVYFQNGAELNGYEIRPRNANDFYNYLKSYFVLKDGMNKEKYDALLRDYVNAISDSVILPSLKNSIEVMEKDINDEKDKLDLAKAERKALVKKKTERDNLEKAVSKAKITLEACKQLISLSPNKISDVREEIDSLMAEQETLIKAAEKVLIQYK